jgi:tetratricopeptide (TPR) repeat protein
MRAKIGVCVAVLGLMLVPAEVLSARDGGRGSRGGGGGPGSGASGGINSLSVPSARSFNASAAGGLPGGAMSAGSGGGSFRAFSGGGNPALGGGNAMRSFSGSTRGFSGGGPSAVSGGNGPTSYRQFGTSNNLIRSDNVIRSGDAFRSGNALRSGDAFRSGNVIRSGDALRPGSAWNKNLGDGGSSRAAFLKNNFPNQTFSRPTSAEGAERYQANRFNSTLSLDGGKSFVRSQNINNKDLNHWTHNNGKWGKGDWSKGDWNKGNWNRNNWNDWHKGHWAGNWHHHKHGKNFVFSPFFLFGTGPLWGGWGWPYYGWGYGYGYPLYAYNFYGYGDGYYATYPYTTSYTTTYAAAPADAAAYNQAQPAGAGDFAEQGEIDFKAGRYQAAARDWQHALVDDPKNGALVMLLAQALFALGQYDEAAGAVQAGMQMLPQDKWGVVIAKYAELYGNLQDYTDQVKALEKARAAQPDSPAVRFLLGFHYGYLGYPKHAVRELDAGLAVAPRDFGARKVRDIFAAKWPQAPPLPAAALEAAKELERDAAGAPAGGPAPGAQPPGARPGNAPAPTNEEPGTPS